MADLFLRVLSVGGAVTVILLPLTLGHRWVEARYNAQTRWLLALGVAVVLLLAPLFPRSAAPLKLEVPTHAVALDRTGVGVIGPLDIQVAELPGKVPGTPAAQISPRGSVDWTELAAMAWLAVAAALLAVQTTRYLFARHKLLKNSYPLGDGGGTGLRVLSGLGSPITLGFLRPVIFLPSEETDAMAVRHEQTHIQRRDVWGKGLLFLACALYWFHPLVWLMARQAGRDAEAACDAQLTGTMAPEERRAYGELLLAAAGGGGSIPFATRFGGSKEQMKARLTQLFRPGKESRMLVGVLLLAALILSSLVACQSEQTAGRPNELPDGTYWGTSMASDVSGSYLVGSAGAEGEDYSSIRLTLVRYGGEEGPNGESLGEYTLLLSDKLTLREDGYDPGEKGTEAWKRAVDTFLHWPIFRDSVSLGEDHLILDVEDGEVVHMQWANVIRVEAHEVKVPDAEAGLQMTLTGEIPFIDSETGAAQFIFALEDVAGESMSVQRYAIHDINGDGIDELLLWVKRGEAENSWLGLTLYWEDGLMYAHREGYLSPALDWMDFADVVLY